MDLSFTHPPDYLVIGHVTKDVLTDGGSAPGGTVTYSGITAQRFGLQAAIMTSCASDDDYLLDPARDEGIWVCNAPSRETTTFRNVYTSEGHRTQTLLAHAEEIKHYDIPEAWLMSPIVHLGPVAQELAAHMPALFPDCLLGVTPQGWMRSWDQEGLVEHVAWPVPRALLSMSDNAILVLSLEDIDFRQELFEIYSKLCRRVAITQGPDEAFVAEDGRLTRVPASLARIVDPTGAGDVFAAALLVRYRETGNMTQAAYFAHAAAACAIEGEGVEGIANRNTVQERMGVMRDA